MIEIQHEEDGENGSFYIPEGDEHVAKMTYRRQNESLVTIEHTVVDDRFRGQGVGRQLLDAAVAWARETNTRFYVTCPFALAQFKKDASIQDVLADSNERSAP
jgi:predicted GNAT family acetyltransferase